MFSVFTTLGQLARETARRLVSPRAYSITAGFFNDACLLHGLGFEGFQKLTATLEKSRVGEPLETLRVPNLRYPIQVRPGTADAIEVGHTVVRQCYGQHALSGAARLIIDAGANIGDSTCWFLSRYPDAHVIALEPDSANFELLTRNTRPYGDRVTCLKAGLWTSDAPLKVHDGGSTIAMFVQEAGDLPADCSGLSPQTLLSRFAPEMVDIFKIDIEGAETRLFCSGTRDWLPRCRLVFVDVHSADAERAVRVAADEHGFRCKKYRELVVLQNRRSEYL
jgi:FkbM family methyltransferase